MFGYLNKVTKLDLSNNSLDGPIPPVLGNLSSLRWLLLNNNELAGPIPAALSNLGELIRLDLAENPDLTCWETMAARIWALGLPYYEGPRSICGFDQYLWLPHMCSAN